MDEKAILAVREERDDSGKSGTISAETSASKKKRGRPRKTSKKPESMEPVFSVEQFADFTAMLLDGITRNLETTSRPPEEKVALAKATCDVANKHIPNSEYGEEIVLAFIAIPIGLSIAVEYLTKNKKRHEKSSYPIAREVGDGEDDIAEIHPGK